MSRHDMGGFTIIETIIFLAVSTVVFAGSVTVYSNRQKEVAFSQGVRDLQSQIETAINDVATGYYPPSALTCNGSGPSLTFSAAGTSDGSCIYLGKAFTSGYGSGCNNTTSGRQACSNYSIIPIAAKRQLALKNVINFAEARPVALDGSASPLRPNSTSRLGFSNGISVYNMFRRDASGNNLGQVTAAFTTSISNSANFSSLNGSNAVNLLAIPVSSSNEANAVSAINSLNTAPSSIINPSNGIALCIVGGNNQKAVITIGAGQRSTDVVVQSTTVTDPGCN